MSDSRISVKNLNLFYREFQALKNINIELQVIKYRVDRPSGCGKSTFLRTLNRMNDLIEGV
jgi:phosphate transport system ATP-binding protein